jgi:AbrB family looped-hinge helix DNA binding protein
MSPQIATVTDKLQFTIPIRIAKSLGVKSGEKVQVAEKNGSIIITPAKQLLSELEGLLSIPKKWKDKDIDDIIKQSKTEYFKKKYAIR